MDSKSLLSAEATRRALALRDLTDPQAGVHAMQLLLRDLQASLAAAWGCSPRVHREPPVVSVHDNYDALNYPPGGAARDARYTRYLSEGVLLRTQTSAMIPRLLQSLAADRDQPADVLLVCPGLVYRRDAIDRLHTGEPHQVDVWRVRTGDPLGGADLRKQVRLVTETLLPGLPWRISPAEHPYTVDGLQIDVQCDGEWVEIGECGLALPALLAHAGLGANASGLAMGLGLDRVLMLRKGIGDIRLLRATDPRVCGQLLDLEPYRPVSNQPAIQRDISVAVPAGTNEEDLGDWVRSALPPEDRDCVESVSVLSSTPGESLPPAAVARIGLKPGQANMLLRIVLRHPLKTLTSDEANRLRDEIYATVHKGTAWQWAGPRP